METTTGSRPYHIVQISMDESLFESDRDDAPLTRQKRYAQLLAERMPGSRLSIIVLAQRPERSRLIADNLQITAMPYGITGLLGLYRQLRHLHREAPIDVITTQNIFLETALALVFARLNGCRVIGQLHYDAFSLVELGTWKGRLKLQVFRLLAPYLFAIRTVGQRIARSILQYGIMTRAYVIPVPAYAVSGSGHCLPSANGKRVLYVGRLVPQKGLEDWLTIAAQVHRARSDVCFDIVGDGPQAKSLQQQADRLGLGDVVRFWGYVPNAALVDRYRSANVFLLTSHYEGFGRVVVEALAHGVPVVAPKIAGVEDIVESGSNGFLHDAGDVSAMAESVLRLIGDEPLTRRMGSLGSADVRRRFDPDELAARWVDLWVRSALPRVPSLLMPRVRTFRRWRAIGCSRLTLLRALEYDALKGLTLTGKTLDIGGGINNSYCSLLKINGEMMSINIDPRMRPSVLADLNRPLPFLNSSFDNVISFNTFEHIKRDDAAVAEALRVLRPGGQFHFIVPFLYQVHGSPSDYHRHTYHWWIERITALGIDPAQLRIEPLVWDRLSSAYSFVGHGKLGRGLKRLITLPAVFADALAVRRHRLSDTPQHRRLLDVPLGYYIYGSKRP